MRGKYKKSRNYRYYGKFVHHKFIFESNLFLRGLRTLIYGTGSNHIFIKSSDSIGRDFRSNRNCILQHPEVKTSNLNILKKGLKELNPRYHIKFHNMEIYIYEKRN